MKCYQPIYLKSERIFVPCGHCLACRLAKSAEWSARLQLEAPYWKKVGFLTLTYDDEHLPEGGSLKPKDLQDFWKRLRKYGRDFKYYACGEYGGKFGRPHYHAILFGFEPTTYDRLVIRKYWKFGTASLDYVNRKSINYVCGYVMKKYSKEINKNEYTEKGLEIPFQRCSRGLGLDYALAHGTDLQRDLSVRLYNGRELPLPRYFVKKLGIDTELLKNKASDSMVKFLTVLFRKLKINKLPTVGNLSYLLYESKDFDTFERLNSALLDIDRQKRDNYESKNKLFNKK